MESAAPGVKQLQELILRIIGLSGGLAFVALVVMLVIGGIKYLTSGGESKSLTSAQQTITWALLGMLFLAVAWLVLKLVYALSGVDVTNFCLSVSPC